MPQPIARLKAASKTPRELVVHASIGAEAAWATAVLKMGGDCMENPSSRWIFRHNRADIKSDAPPAQALVLFGASAAAAKDAKDKQSAKENLKKRMVRAKFGAAADKAAAKKKAASANDTVKTFRGAGVSVESFACAIANFV